MPRLDMSAQAILDRMCDSEVQDCWDAIMEGGLRDANLHDLINGVPVDDWMLMVKAELEIRQATGLD